MKDIDNEIEEALYKVHANMTDDEILIEVHELKDSASSIGMEWSIDWDAVYGRFINARCAEVDKLYGEEDEDD